MLVKIIAMGLSPAIWKNVFHHLRSHLPRHPFAAGIFAAPEEIAYLTGEFFPGQWSRECPDVLFCEAPGGTEWRQRLAFLESLQAGEGGEPPLLALTLRTMEHGLRQLVQGPVPVELELDNSTAWRVRDPALVIRAFPPDFPRLRVDEHITALLLRRRDKATAEVRPEVLKPGTLVGFAELEGVRVGEDTLAPEDWLKRTLRTTREKLPDGGCPGLIREGRGLFLFPGVPLNRVSAVRLGAVRFGHLLDLGQLTPESVHYRALLTDLRRVGEAQREAWEAHTDRIRLAETKTDLPIVCAGGAPLVREALCGLLREEGFRRCTTLEMPAEGTFREPTLLLQLGPWRREDEGAQVEEPQRVPLENELAERLAPLDGLLAWRELAHKPLASPPDRLTPQRYRAEREQVLLREQKAGAGLELAGKRELLLRQERQVLRNARSRLDALLEGEEALEVWMGRARLEVRQALVFSYDREEAGAVLQALGGIAKKRWFDLGECDTPEALAALDLTPLDHYREGGVALITAAGRDRLRTLQAAVREALEANDRALEEAERAQRFYAEESERIRVAKETLARRWVHDALADWLGDYGPRLLERLEVLRARHERRWFSRALVNRVAIVPSSGANRPALMAACRRLYPGLNEEHSRVVHYDYEALDALPPEAQEALARESRELGEPPETLRQRRAEALVRENAQRFAQYLEVVTAELADVKADLLIIEHGREVAFPLLEHLRRSLESYADVPAVLVLPELWSPDEREPMPWPWTRAILMRRMGALTVEETTDQLRALYAA